jgi:hypothetical protein
MNAEFPAAWMIGYAKQNEENFWEVHKARMMS